jgi:hypothetical protein
MKHAGQMNMYEGEKKCIQSVYMSRSDGSRPLGRPTHKWKNSIKMHLKEIKTGWHGLDLSVLGHGQAAFY